MSGFSTGKTGCHKRLKRKPLANCSRAKQETLEEDYEYRTFLAQQAILNPPSTEQNVCNDPNPDADPDYMIFLQSLKKDRKNINRGHSGGKDCTMDCSFEKDDGRSGASSTSEKAVDYPYWWCLEEEIGSHHSQFREKLMEILSLPYDEREYQLLWKNISNRKPKQRRRELRGREVSYSGAYGKSYLDYYPAVKEKLQNEKNRHKALNLLRGFFFWLKNLMHKGAFLPWLDSSCLKVEP
ncbi:hypothetical protein SLE2022_368560 [Rubroshorea leprosula]